jgi:hypothetical protein
MVFFVTVFIRINQRVVLNERPVGLSVELRIGRLRLYGIFFVFSSTIPDVAITDRLCSKIENEQELCRLRRFQGSM